ncbi:phosphate ABC transporter permease subunit PstC [Plantactinospora sp. KLBMP9567]|uniref:phosphate ABC transporter permease subunit PstC n=1 Tax=Plantactinospora sp. KLBMP9567 TaxID=3085900 RepID=UPI002980D1EE|nr:phosphate ABC transporter permease subunit PstC [Plantactinospora sp. KLBMP9567]MDW5329598.1 phosphate ABC transporter permease subunit PstC [Plantactinospora sp. KLBMP9567]
MVTIPGPRVPAAAVRRGRRHPGERIIETLLVVAAAVSIATTIGIVVSLAVPTVEFFGEVSLVEFVTSTQWTPLFADKNYGVAPLLVATLWVTAIATVIAVPLGIGAAIYLSEYARPGTRKVLKPVLEILAGIPTVVYGFFALTFLNPGLIDLWPGASKPEFQNLLVAGIAMGIMIVPTVASLSEDAMSAVPHSLREGAYALASSKMQVATRVVVPAALSGIVAAIVLGVSRALGETMIVTIAAGLKTAGIPGSPIEGAATMTGYIAGAGQGDLPVDSLDYLTIFAVGATLFAFTFVLNAISIRLVRRFREVYE